MKPPSPPLPTVAQALLEIEQWNDLAVPQRRSLASALSFLCKILGNRSPMTVRLDPATCLPAIDSISAVAAGISAKTHQNYRAGVRRVLRRLGLLAPAHRREPVSDPNWMRLLDALPKRFHPHRLRAFMGFCAERAIAPDAVTSSTLEAYLRHRIETRGGKNVRSDVREVARQWNKMRQIVPGWPETELTLAAPADCVRALPLTIYPASLQAEIEDFLGWLAQSPEDADDDANVFDPAP